MKGFASLLFIALLAESMVLLSTLQHESLPRANGIPEHLALKRIELENGIDRVIESELQGGLIRKQSSREIKTRINERIAAFIHDEIQDQGGGIAYSLGFAALGQTEYLSLATSPLTPFSMEKLDSFSHVLVLPLDADNWYGEYTYTGGGSGTSILVVQMKGGEFDTLYALPSGHRTCATTFLVVPCIIPGEP